MTKRKEPQKPKQSSLLTRQQQSFVNELLSDENMNATAAYQRVYHCSLKAAESGASRTLRIAKVDAAIKLAQKERQDRTKITHDDVVRRLMLMLEADHNNIVQHRRVCCRHCYGKNFEFQWKNEAEFERACVEAEQRADENKKAVLPTDDGGYGFNPTLHPHPHCPNCYGEGYGDVHFCDTRLLKGGERLLYAGVKQTQHGLEVKTHDQMAVLDKLMRHLGMFNDKLTLKGDEDNPLLALINRVSGNTLKPVDDGEGG